MEKSKISLGKIGILGDSYSTFKNLIPKGYPTYYSDSAHTENGVMSPDKTWWGLLAQKTNSLIALNSSYSGSTVCNTGYNGNYCINSSFVARTADFIPEKTPLDTIFIFGGTNDNWAGSPIGELNYEKTTAEDLKSFLPALCKTLSYFKENYNSGTRTVFLINTDLKDEITNGIITACKHYKTEYIKFSHITKNGGHPTAVGMEEIAEEIINYFEDNKI